MILLIELLLVSLPLTALSVMVAGHAVEPAWILSAALALFYLLDRVGGGAPRAPRGSEWGLAVLLFIGIGAFGLLWSPYGTAASWNKGVIQVLGVCAALGAALAIARSIEWNPALFQRFVRLLVVVLYWVSVVGIFQFLAFNVLRMPALGDFRFFEQLTGNEGAWRYPGELGGIVRASSIAAEPTHLAQYLACASGLVWLRLGLYGRAWSDAVRPFLARREALVILGCAALTLSIVGYAAFLLSLGALYVLHRRLTLGSVLPVLAATALAVVAGLWWVGGTEREIGTKIATIPTILATVEEIGDTVDTQAISAIAIAGNRVVTASNLEARPFVGIGLGAHPESFRRVAPQWAGISNRLNAQDASGLLLRLLSETGLVGCALFLGVWFVVLRRARGCLLRRAPPSTTEEPRRGLALGVAAGCAAVFAAYLVRMGVYYAPTIWILLALTSCVPTLLGRSDAAPQELAAGR